MLSLWKSQSTSSFDETLRLKTKISEQLPEQGTVADLATIRPSFLMRSHLRRRQTWLM